MPLPSKDAIGKKNSSLNISSKSSYC